MDSTQSASTRLDSVPAVLVGLLGFSGVFVYMCNQGYIGIDNLGTVMLYSILTALALSVAWALFFKRPVLTAVAFGSILPLIIASNLWLSTGQEVANWRVAAGKLSRMPESTFQRYADNNGVLTPEKIVQELEEQNVIGRQINSIDRLTLELYGGKPALSLAPAEVRRMTADFQELKQQLATYQNPDADFKYLDLIGRYMYPLGHLKPGVKSGTLSSDNYCCTYDEVHTFPQRVNARYHAYYPAADFWDKVFGK